MDLFKSEKSVSSRRIIELSILLGFVALTVFLVVINPQTTSPKVEETIQSPGVTAIASAMPHQGWAPMTVYFSGYGSHSDSGRIVQYEWDLDSNGLYETIGSGEHGYASYTYNKPGQFLVTLKVTDVAGNTASESIFVDVRHPASSPVDYWTIFDDSMVRKVEIRITKDNYDLMWEDIEAKLTVPIDAVIFGELFENVGFRMRGQFSMRTSGEKKPWKIDMDYFQEGQEYYNLKQLMFINNIGDHSLMREKIAYDMMHFAGIPASHVAYVELWIDFTDDDAPAEYWGVYTMVERVDLKFLASRFGRDYRHGNLYKASHAVRGPMDLIYYGSDIADYPKIGDDYAYGKATNEQEGDYSDVVNLAYVIDGMEYETPEEFTEALEQVFNVDGYLRYMAVMISMSCWDMYPYTGNNFYLYNNPGTGKFEWIPWDLTWGGDFEMPLYTLQGPGLVERAPLYDRVFEVEEYRLRYAAYLDLLTKFWFNYENMAKTAKGYSSLIQPYLTQSTGDKDFVGGEAMFENALQSFQYAWEEIAGFTQSRNAYIQEQLKILPLDENMTP